MTLQSLSDQLRRVLGAHAALGRLGFDADDIFTLCVPLANCSCPRLHVVVHLRYNGKSFVYDCGPTEISTQEDWDAYLRPAFEAWNAASQEERHEVYTQSEAYRDAVGFAAALARKGIRPPRIDN